MRQLDAFKVDYVVVHRDYYASDEWSALVARLPAYANRLVLVHSDAHGSVYAMRRGRD